MTERTLAARETEHVVLFREPYSYLAHPDVIRLADGALLMVFNRGPRREIIMHPPQDPMFMNVVTRSTDDGESWTPPEVVPSYGWTGTECAGLTELSDKRVMLNQWCGNWLPLARARSMSPEPQMTWPAELLEPWVHAGAYVGHPAERNPEAHAPWCRNGGRAYVHFSSDGGISYPKTVEVSPAPLIGGYGNRGGVVVNDRILLPLTDAYRFITVFLVSSDDGGRSWSAPRVLANREGSEFEEPATLVTRTGRILMVLRDNGRHTLYALHSDDGGESWSELRDLETAGHPAHLVELSEGRILMTYGWRRPDYGIRAVWSDDDGESWSESQVVIRDDLGNGNLGYPCTLPCADGRLLTIYYGEDAIGTTCIQHTRWQMPS